MIRYDAKKQEQKGEKFNTLCIFVKIQVYIDSANPHISGIRGY